MPNLKEISRGTWNNNGSTTCEEINAGSLQRIADATEAMSRNYVELQNQVDYYKKRMESLQEQNETLFRSNAALRGVITKLKKRQAHD